MFSRIIVIFICFIFSIGNLYGDEKFLLVTGTARSGTFYITKVLKECGLDIKHELFGSDGACSWLMVPETDETPWGPGRKGVVFKHILHQIRDPLKSMSSIYTTEPPQAWTYIMQNIPEITWMDPKLVRCAKYWYYWNLKAEKLAEFSYPVEDIENQWENLERVLGMKLDKTSLDRISKDVNTRGGYKLEVTWKLLKRELDPYLFKQIQIMAQRYGYAIEDK